MLKNIVRHIKNTLAIENFRWTKGLVIRFKSENLISQIQKTKKKVPFDFSQNFFLPRKAENKIKILVKSEEWRRKRMGGFEGGKESFDKKKSKKEIHCNSLSLLFWKAAIEFAECRTGVFERFQVYRKMKI